MQKSFPASMDSLYEMLDFIGENSKREFFDAIAIQKLELAAEEALVNVISYSGLDQSGQILISCSSDDLDGIKIVITDEGIPYNPLDNICHIDKTTPLENRKIGGYGIHLIMKIMDKVDYERQGSFNVLTLIKYKKV